METTLEIYYKIERKKNVSGYSFILVKVIHHSLAK